MFGNELRTKLLEQKRAENLFDEGVRDRDWNHKMIHKTYADNGRDVAKNPVMAGDVALMKNTKRLESFTQISQVSHTQCRQRKAVR